MSRGTLLVMTLHVVHQMAINWAVTVTRTPWGAYNTKHKSATLTLREGIHSFIGTLITKLALK